MKNVIGLGPYLRGHPLRSMAAGAGRHEQLAFTARDRADLARWASDDRSVEYVSCEFGHFAMLYEDGRPWASWGMVRQAGKIRLWDCVSHADVGRFPTMLAALSNLGDTDYDAPPANVIYLFGMHGNTPAASLSQEF